jgi:peptidoglycan/LPS O-acetylase OafA/YrhL
VSARIEHLPTLDGWRAVAIAMVMFCHVPLPGGALSWISPYGAIGVHVFFAISGFLITYRLLEEAARDGSIDLRRFYIRRAFRILPPAMLYLAIVAALRLADWKQIAASAFFYRNYLTGDAAKVWYTGHYWSLSVEEHFYLLWPGLLVLAGVSRGYRLAPVMAVAVACWRSLDHMYHWTSATNLVTRTDYRFDGLLWGCAAAFVWQSRRRVPGWAALGAVALAGCAVWRQWPGAETLLALALPLPLLATVSHARSPLSRLLDSPPIAWFGRISYSVYLWQMLFLPTYNIPVSLGIAQKFPYNLGLAVAAASISFYCVEQAFRDWGRRLGSRRSDTPSIRSRDCEDARQSAVATNPAQ